MAEDDGPPSQGLFGGQLTVKPPYSESAVYAGAQIPRALGASLARA